MTDIVERLRALAWLLPDDPKLVLLAGATEIEQLRKAISAQYAAHKVEIDRLCARISELEKK
jgi:aryl-alcohol dehydrogenase-like predicted oxidoreductase